MPNYYTNMSAVFNESEDLVTTVYASQKFPLGMIRERDGKRYRFVKHTMAGSVAAVAGNVAYWSATANVVSADESATTSGVPAGIWQGVVADGGYGWIQTRGNATLNTAGDDDIPAGALLYATSTDGKVECLDATIFTTTAATLAQIQRLTRVVGFSLAADDDSGNTVAAFVTLE